MKVLLVDDHEAIATVVNEFLLQNNSESSTSVATTARDARGLLEQGPYDLVICDRRIPEDIGNLDTPESNGDAVVELVKIRYPGTPIIILTGFESLDLLRGHLQASRSGDPFGVGTTRALVTVHPKTALSPFLAEVGEMATQLRTVDEIEVQQNGFSSEKRLTRTENRVVRLFARLKGGAIVRVSPIGGGLSNARTCRVLVEDARGALRASTFAKIGRLDLLADESRRYSDLLQGILPIASFAPLGHRIECGAGDVGGLFYSLADGYGDSLFDILIANPDRAAHLVTKLLPTLACWSDHSTREPARVADVRRLLLRDEAKAERFARIVFGRDWDSFESKLVNADWCPEHGDFHGHNVLVNPSDDVVLIDYGDLKRAPASLDLVMLELSILFHPKNVLGLSDWPTVEQAEHWDDLDTFSAGSPYSSFVAECRRNALKAAAGDREVYACAYAYALRQLKYADTDHALAAAIARAARNAFERDT